MKESKATRKEKERSNMRKRSKVKQTSKEKTQMQRGR